jgi:hypothetical protein
MALKEYYENFKYELLADGLLEDEMEVEEELSLHEIQEIVRLFQNGIFFMIFQLSVSRFRVYDLRWWWNAGEEGYFSCNKERSTTASASQDRRQEETAKENSSNKTKSQQYSSAKGW